MKKGVYKISEVERKPVVRISTGIRHLNGIYGGGLPRGRVSIWSGAPGVGKSRTTIDIAKRINKMGGMVLYFQNEVAPEEFAVWVVDDEIDPSRFLCSNYDTIEEQIEAIRKYRPDFVVTDSLNMIQGFSSSTKIRDIMNGFKEVIAEVEAHAILIGHLNKAGETKGNSDIPHLVDIVCHLKPHKDWKDDYGNKHNALKGVFIIVVDKNRYGESDGWVAFQHDADGVHEVTSIYTVTGQEVVAPQEENGLSKVFGGLFRWLESKTG